MIPKTITLDNVVYKVKLKKGPLYDCEDGVTYVGEIKNDEAKITLDKTKPHEVLRPIIMHEIIHGIFYLRGLEHFIVEGMDEYVVDNVARGIYDVIVNNKDLIEYLREDFDEKKTGRSDIC